MTVSKRLRFEILRRDNHACRYCGAAAPDAKLTVDHVVPVALGGADEPSNLVAACQPCNSGKGASSPDAPLVADVTEAALRWGRAVEIAAHGLAVELLEQQEARLDFLSMWNAWGDVPLPDGWPDTLDRLLARGLPLDVINECVDIAMRRSNVSRGHVFRYFCGVAWRKVAALTDIAKDIYDAWEIDGETRVQA